MVKSKYKYYVYVGYEDEGESWDAYFKGVTDEYVSEYMPYERNCKLDERIIDPHYHDSAHHIMQRKEYDLYMTCDKRYDDGGRIVGYRVDGPHIVGEIWTYRELCEYKHQHYVMIPGGHFTSVNWINPTQEKFFKDSQATRSVNSQS